MSSSIDRQHVTTSVASTSTSGGGGSVLQCGQYNLPQTMEELLEKQWEQGSHFLMTHANFDGFFYYFF